MADDIDEPGKQRGDEHPPAAPTTVPTLDDLLDGPELEDASDVLILGPLRRSLDDEVCRSFLCAGDEPPRHVLVVSLTMSVRNRLAVLRELGQDRPTSVKIISATADFRGPTTETEFGEGAGGSVTVETIPDPSDLTRLGFTISETVAPWRDESGPTVVCFHSLTAMLQYADPQRTFRFIHLLQQQLASAGAVTHYHMDAAAHDEQTVATLQTLFDAIVEVSPEGEARLVG